ncbi:TIGR04222 domain-containing membrane protein [Hymenobacter sp. H14-R3]|uniref:TIGR04222 domain-containing membrane protein n=1 Tax=Hymenobacter sp. H14-R3 TaxID=3046308 RepID=UPI0024B97A50|nr:TIGR04222 domain-containing membrane protein [Hymenobacter sp. H14-R3]MDJ0364352.1 TIGR04222 domain-containing membrane protein [Hymenobacter sp. H14-R3]
MPIALPPAPQSELWARLVALDLDGQASLSFSHRLARDNGWPLAFARRVVLEYKKFVYLAATCGHPVTPSDEVDQAWHLHLVYTRSYWEELCGQVLGFALHHGPTKGGAAEGHKFREWYTATKQAYQAAFGEMPPADIWPAAAVRFGEAPHFRRVNLRRHWLLPRPAMPRLRGRLALPNRRWGLALAAALVLVGCTARTPLNPFDWYGTEFLRLFWGVYALSLALALWLRARGAGPQQSYEGPLLSTYEVVRLANRGSRLADSALAALAHSQQIELLPDQKIRRATDTPPTVPYERAVWNLIVQPGSSKVETVRDQANRQIKVAVRDLDQSLQAKGLLLGAAARRRLDYYPPAATLAVVLFGLIKLVVGLVRGRPVGFLILSLLAISLIGGVAYLHGAWATGRGKYVLRELARRTKQGPADGALTTQSVAFAVAFFGLNELNNLGLASLATHLAPPATTSGGDSSGGDGGGDGGGSGCGGCGGGD